MVKQKNSKMRQKINDLYEENEYYSIKANQNRARGVTVGTAFGGVVEISLRSETGFIYALIQPTEVVELIEQLAAGIGVEIAMRPKQNFASWRGWEEVIDQRIGWDRIAWKGAAAWQLGGERLEDNLKQLKQSIEEMEKKNNLLPSSEKEKVETEEQPKPQRTRKSIKQKIEVSDNEEEEKIEEQPKLKKIRKSTKQKVETNE